MEVQKKKLILSSWSLDSHPTREEGNIALPQCSVNIALPQSWTKDFVQDYFRFGKVMGTLLYLKWITNEILLYSTWNSAQCYVPAWMGGGLGENGFRYMYGWVPSLKLVLSLETTTTHLTGYTPIQKTTFKVWKRKKIYISITKSLMNYWWENIKSGYILAPHNHP